VAGANAAELIADGGAAACSDDFFRSAAFLAAEGTTHTLRLVAGERTALVPLIVRDVEGAEHRDAVSPYGYPGASTSGTDEPPAAAEVDWSGCGLVTIFGRERLAANPWLADPAQRSHVLIHDPSKERAVRPRLAEQIRANERDGWRVEVLAGPDSPADARDAFARAYEQTMHRAEAAERYFFAREYFDAVLGFERSWLVVAERDGEVGAAAIAAVSDDILHYYLGGTAERARSASPFKNVVTGMLDLSDELGLALNLGGGVTEGDGLERFKRGFANGELAFHTQEVVCDPVAYEQLAAGRDAGGFFPAYRAG
jgi:hypothetical protein